MPSTLNPSSIHLNGISSITRSGRHLHRGRARAGGRTDPTGPASEQPGATSTATCWPDLYVNNDVSMHASIRRPRQVQRISASPRSPAMIACTVSNWRSGLGQYRPNRHVPTHWIAQEIALSTGRGKLRRGRSPSAALHGHLRQRGPRPKHARLQTGGDLSSISTMTGRAGSPGHGEWEHIQEQKNDHSKLVAMKKSSSSGTAASCRGLFETTCGIGGFFEVEDVAGDASASERGAGTAIRRL